MKHIITLNSCPFTTGPSRQECGVGEYEQIIVKTTTEKDGKYIHEYRTVFKGDKFSVDELLEREDREHIKKEMLEVLSNVM